MPVIKKQVPRKKKHVKRKIGGIEVAKDPLSRRPIKTVKKRKSTGQTSIIDRIAPIGFSEDEGIKINVYGRSATGKTTLWGTFPKPILAIVASGSAKPGELRSLDTPDNRKMIKQITLERTSDIREVVQYQRETDKFATIVLDHATGLQDYILKEVLGLEELPEQLSWGIATQQNWGQVAMKCKELLRHLLNLSCNVVIVAQEREFNVDSDESLVMPFVASALTPSTVGWLNPAVDYIVQTRIQPRMEMVKVKVGKNLVEKQVAGKGSLATSIPPIFLLTCFFFLGTCFLMTGIFIAPYHSPR